MERRASCPLRTMRLLHSEAKQAHLHSAHSGRIASAGQILQAPEKEDAGDSGRPTRQWPDSAKRSDVSGCLIAALNAGAVRHRVLLETGRLRVRSLADRPLRYSSR